MSVKAALVGVKFDKNVLIFKAGESITGNVTFNGGPREKKLYDLKLSLIRRSDYVFVTEQTKKGKATSLNHLFTSHFAQGVNQTVASEALSKSSAVVSPQSATQIPFSFTLPQNLWSSFVVTNAYTWYGLLLSGREGSEHGKREKFLLKRDPIIIGAVREGDRDSKFNAPFKSVVNPPGLVGGKIRLSLKKTWAIPGERLPFRVEALGTACPGNCKVVANLQQNIGYKFISRHYGRHMRTTEAFVVWTEDGMLEEKGGENKQWIGSVEIPYVPPTGLGAEGCQHFTVNYVLQIGICKVAGGKLETEIHIGTHFDEGPTEELGRDDSSSIAYGLGVTRSLSSSSYSLDWDAVSLASEDSGCWSLMEDDGA